MTMMLILGAADPAAPLLLLLPLPHASTAGRK